MLMSSEADTGEKTGDVVLQRVRVIFFPQMTPVSERPYNEVHIAPSGRGMLVPKEEGAFNVV